MRYCRPLAPCGSICGISQGGAQLACILLTARAAVGFLHRNLSQALGLTPFHLLHLIALPAIDDGDARECKCKLPSQSCHPRRMNEIVHSARQVLSRQPRLLQAREQFRLFLLRPHTGQEPVQSRPETAGTAIPMPVRFTLRYCTTLSSGLL